MPTLRGDGHQPGSYGTARADRRRPGLWRPGGHGDVGESFQITPSGAVACLGGHPLEDGRTAIGVDFPGAGDTPRSLAPSPWTNWLTNSWPQRSPKAWKPKATTKRRGKPRRTRARGPGPLPAVDPHAGGALRRPAADGGAPGGDEPARRRPRQRRSPPSPPTCGPSRPRAYQPRTRTRPRLYWSALASMRRSCVTTPKGRTRSRPRARSPRRWPRRLSARWCSPTPTPHSPPISD
jgi:hypothetical protein